MAVFDPVAMLRRTRSVNGLYCILKSIIILLLGKDALHYLHC